MATSNKTVEKAVTEELKTEIAENVEKAVTEELKTEIAENVEKIEETIKEAEKKPLTDADFDKEAKKWGKIYAKEPKRKIKIYLPKDSKDTSPVPVIINGYSYFINKGETVEVPESVAKILENANYI